VILRVLKFVLERSYVARRRAKKDEWKILVGYVIQKIQFERLEGGGRITKKRIFGNYVSR
jgi:hypothetical protein